MVGEVAHKVEIVGFEKEVDEGSRWQLILVHIRVNLRLQVMHDHNRNI